jgi:cell division protein FtsI (penicillin-binding protein 3)
MVAGPAFRRVTEAALRHLGVPARHHDSAQASQRRARRKPADDAAPPAAGEQDRAREPAPKLGDDERSVPELMGLNARAALMLVGQNDLEMAIEGSGIVVSQTPAAGAVVAAGTRVEISLEPPAHTRDDQESEPALDGLSGPLARAAAAPGSPP